MRIVAVLAMGMALSACHKAAPLSADDAWVRLPGAAGRPAAAYFTLYGGPDPATLVAISAPFAARAELHETMPDMSAPTAPGSNPPSTMAPLDSVVVPAGQTVRFEPGGRHVMLFDVKPGARAGTAAPLTLRFADGRTLQVDAQLIGAGDPAPR